MLCQGHTYMLADVAAARAPARRSRHLSTGNTETAAAMTHIHPRPRIPPGQVLAAGARRYRSAHIHSLCAGERVERKRERRERARAPSLGDRGIRGNDRGSTHNGERGRGTRDTWVRGEREHGWRRMNTRTSAHAGESRYARRRGSGPRLYYRACARMGERDR